MADCPKRSFLDSSWARGLRVALPAVAGASLVSLARGAYLAHTLGVALCLFAAAALWSEIAAARAFAQPLTVFGRQVRGVPGALPQIALLVLVAVLLWPLLVGEMPQSRDHTVHLARAWHFVTRMLAEGQLSGWSDLWFAGWPAGEDYPPGADYWVAAFYLGTAGMLGWEASYALAFLSAMAVFALALYHFGKTYVGRTAGLLAGLFWLLDRGQHREGGWVYTVWWGVWPQVLSTAFTLLAFCALDRTLRRDRSPRQLMSALAVGGLWTGLALLCHPMAALCFALGVPVLLAVRLLGDDLTAPPLSQALVRVLAVLVLGAGLAAFWIIPFAVKREWMASYGATWKTLPQIALGLLRGDLFGHMLPALIWLGLLGGGVAAWRGHRGGLFVGSLVAVLLLFAALPSIASLEPITRAFAKNIQFQRLSLLTKPCLMLLAGYLLQVLFADQRRPRQTGWRPGVLLALVLVAVAPFVGPLWRAWHESYGRDIGQPVTRRQIPNWSDYQRFLAWSRTLEQRRRQRGEPSFRIAYDGLSGDHFFAAAPVFNGVSAYKVGFTPATNFIHKPKGGAPALYRALGVRYVVRVGARSWEHLSLERRFGTIHVYRFAGYSPRKVTVIGPGRVEVARFERERVQLRVAGTDSNSRIVLHRANYANWAATCNGAPAPIRTATLAGERIFIGLPGCEGTIEVRYRWPLVNVVSSLASWCSVIALLLLGMKGRASA